MSFVDMLRFAADALSQHRRRSVLSLLGVAVGVVTVVSLTALGEGARRYVTDQFSALGSALIIVMPGRTETSGGFPGFGGAPNPLTLDDATALKRQLPEVTEIVPMTVGSADIARLDRSRQIMVIGSTANFRTVRELRMLNGRFLPEGDVDRAASVVVIGKNVAHELFGEENALGQPVRVSGWRMRVIGVLESRGTQMGTDIDEIAIIPVATGLRMANSDSLGRLVLQLHPRADMNATRRRIIDIMKDRHGEEDITCMTQEAVLSSLTAILRALTLVVSGIAAISLGVAGIGIMNVMLVSVSERTSEVGLLKALGATQRQILGIFLIEAVLLSTAGGALGLASGWLFIEGVIAFYPSLPATPPLWAVAAVVLVSFATGSIFGVLPAWRAARLDPVAALTSK